MFLDVLSVLLPPFVFVLHHSVHLLRLFVPFFHFSTRQICSLWFGVIRSQVLHIFGALCFFESLFDFL